MFSVFSTYINSFSYLTNQDGKLLSNVQENSAKYEKREYSTNLSLIFSTKGSVLICLLVSLVSESDRLAVHVQRLKLLLQHDKNALAPSFTYKMIWVKIPAIYFVKNNYSSFQFRYLKTFM